MKNKNKSLKIVLGIIITLIVLVIGFIILIVTEVIPNPFLDTKDLVCERGYALDENSYFIEKKFFKFNFKAYVKYIKQENITKYFDEELAKKYYDEIIKYTEKDKIKLNGNEIISVINEKNSYSDKTKQEIKEYFEHELAYECK